MKVNTPHTPVPVTYACFQKCARLLARFSPCWHKYAYIYIVPPKDALGGWGFQFCGDKSGFSGPRPLQNEEPATNLGVFSTKSGHPTPCFLVHSYDFQKHWPLQSGEPGMSKHLSRIATWKKENRQKYKGPFCRGMMCKNLGLPVSPENPEMYKNPFCRGNSCSTFPVFVKSI